MFDAASRNIFALLKQYVFWLGFFAFNRMIFFLYNVDDLTGIGFGEIVQSFFHAFFLDTSAACYLLVFPFFTHVVQSLYPHRIFNNIRAWYYFIAIFLVTIVYVSELGIFDEWSGSKLNYKAVSHLVNPDEVMNSVDRVFLMKMLLLNALIITIGFFTYLRFIHEKVDSVRVNYIKSSIMILFVPVILFLGIRGGWQQIPINQSDAYFSDEYNVLNVAAVNSPWNLIFSIIQNKSHMNTNPYVVFPMEEAQATVDSLYHVEKDTTIEIFKTKHPNVVLFILESWSADLIESLGGYEGLTPNFHKMEKEGVLFTQMYASGERSDQGMAAIMSGYPSQPTTSIIKLPDKVRKLPSINTHFRNLGYMSSMYFGGQLIYGNIKAYMYFNKFKRIYEMKDFPDSIPQGQLGVHDEFIFRQEQRDIDKDKEPFFSVIFSVSTHNPFDYPDKKYYNWGGEDNGIVNAVHYSDNAIKEYMEEAKKQPWFNNTLFIFIADHGARTPKKWNFYTPEYRQIPMLFYGNVIKDEFRGTTNDKICSQTDLVATVLAQLGEKHDEFRWSKDIFNPYSKSFAFYAFTDGVGWITKDNAMAYENNLQHYYVERFQNEMMRKKMMKEGQSYLQILIEEYLGF